MSGQPNPNDNNIIDLTGQANPNDNNIIDLTGQPNPIVTVAINRRNENPNEMWRTDPRTNWHGLYRNSDPNCPGIGMKFDPDSAAFGVLMEQFAAVARQDPEGPLPACGLYTWCKSFVEHPRRDRKRPPIFAGKPICERCVKKYHLWLFRSAEVAIPYQQPYINMSIDSRRRTKQFWCIVDDPVYEENGNGNADLRNFASLIRTSLLSRKDGEACGDVEGVCRVCDRCKNICHECGVGRMLDGNIVTYAPKFNLIAMPPGPHTGG